MDEKRKQAYRYLLYTAMLEIRRLENLSLDPLCLLNVVRVQHERRKALEAGAIANWLHNLAHFSSFDFVGFDEACFWKEYERLRTKFKDLKTDYRRVFESRFADYLG